MNKLIAVYNYNGTYNFSTGNYSFGAVFNEAMNRKKEIIPFLNTDDFIKIKLSFNLFINNINVSPYYFYILQELRLSNNKIWLGKPGFPLPDPVSQNYFLFDSIEIPSNTLINYKKEFIINLPKEITFFFSGSGALQITTKTVNTNTIQNIITIEEVD